jgi:hypothetical protein
MAAPQCIHAIRWAENWRLVNIDGMIYNVTLVVLDPGSS